MEFILLSWLRDLQKATPVIIMTSYAEIQGAVLAMKEGAADYVSKPVQPDELLKKSRKQSHRKARLLLHPRKARKNFATQNFLEGESEAARQLYNYVNLVAPTQMSVLINGASGTGKEYVAHRIHQTQQTG